MPLLNLALEDLGAEVIEQSSTSTDGICSPDYLLTNDENKIWCTKEGLPQYVIINLQNVNIDYACIKKVGFHCWYEYATNPKSIEIWVSRNQQQEFIHWKNVQMQKKIGTQQFNIPNIPPSFKNIKFIITETYGEYQTYLNQIFIIAEQQELSLQNQSQFFLNNQQRQFQDKKSANFSMNESRGYRESAKNSSRSSKVSQIHKQIIDKKTQRLHHYTESSKKQFEIQPFNRTEQMKKMETIPRYDSPYLKSNQELCQQFYEEHQRSLQKNIALVTISQHIMNMDEDFECMKRQLNVINFKMEHMNSDFERRIMNKVEVMIDEKIKNIHLPSSKKNIEKSASQYMIVNPKIKQKNYQKTNVPKEKQKQQQPIRFNRQQSLSRIKALMNQKSGLSIKSPVVSNSKNHQNSKEKVVNLMNQLVKKLQQRKNKIIKIQQKKGSKKQIQHEKLKTKPRS